ncbi:anti-sigma factor antagonist [Streptomyces variegatus]|uniref:Anti-sigma factor antagonist n=2 Tax=Streptomyces variegatus TaxID=284040 RepID=A0A0M2GBT9_9ACTN|nr:MULTISPECIES: STAS domain-containing protein [Streptomyces]KJK34237.1 anti-sigma factor antagonist [Streptomyces variegatus]
MDMRLGERRCSVRAGLGPRVVVAHGDYDMNSMGPLAEALQTAAQKHSRVVLDASGVTLADSTLLNLLLHINPMTSLRVAAPTPQLKRVLAITGADTVLDIRDSVADATSD